ncbi:hypothetical protein DRQ36_00570 [bacterium]|nr:MAG: hypothetical protein DRQ36_00570 [bacterium]
MRRILGTKSVALFTLIMASLFVFSGCSKEEEEEALQDGSYWSVVTTEELENPGAVWPLAHEKAIVGADNEHLYITEDDGHGWVTKTLNPETGRKATDFYFTSSKGIMVGERGMLYISSDNGENWSDVFPAGVRDGDLYDIIYPATGEDNPLFICGNEGVLLRSENGGDSWEYIDLYIGEFFDSLAVVDSGVTTWFYDTTLYVTQDQITFYGGYAPTEDLIYLLGDTVGSGDTLLFFRSMDGGDSGSWEMYPFVGHFADMYFFDETNGIMVGDGGYVYTISVAESSISTASLANVGSGRDLMEIEFTDATIGWAIGTGGTVAKTTDGGSVWSLVDVDITGDITDIGFFDETEGWVVGDDVSRGTGAIKVTHDGGETWSFRSYGLGISLYGVHFVSSSEGWVVGKSGRIAHTTDGGAMWIHQDANTDKTFQDVYFADENLGWVVGFSVQLPVDTFATILYTENGGELWTAVDSLDGYRLNKVELADENTGWAIGNEGLILRTEDGGLTWSPQEAGVSAELFGLDVFDTGKAFVVGQHGTILKTTNGGTTWDVLPSGTEQSLMDIDMVDSNTGYACGSMGTILKTTDGGADWTQLDMPAYCESVFKSVAFQNSEVGWVVGKFGYVLHTVDGGESWYRQSEGFTEETLNDIFLMGSNYGWIVGNNSLLMELHPGN